MTEEIKVAEVQTTTPEEDEKLTRLREGLQEWLIAAGNEGIEHELCLTALMLFCASGCASNGIPKEELLGVLGMYYDTYRKNFGALGGVQ